MTEEEEKEGGGGGGVSVRSSSLSESHLANVTIHTGGRPKAFVAPYTHCVVCHYVPLTHPPSCGNVDDVISMTGALPHNEE
jgi:hypothetical protein